MRAETEHRSKTKRHSPQLSRGKLTLANESRERAKQNIEERTKRPSHQLSRAKLTLATERRDRT
jgi:hypothetical protein